jgi:hypothetical protein
MTHNAHFFVGRDDPNRDALEPVLMQARPAIRSFHQLDNRKLERLVESSILRPVCKEQP